MPSTTGPKPKSQKVTVYTPESHARRPRELLTEMVRDFISSRELAWRLFRRNISAQYRQSILGYFWIFLPPLVTTVIWVFLSKSRILQMGETGVPYPVYVLTGNLLWQGFARAMLMPIQSVQSEKAALTKLNFPREALITAGIFEASLNAVIPLIMLIPVYAWYKLPLSGYQLFAPFGFFSLVLFGYTIGLLATPVGLLFTDVMRAIPIGTQFLFFLTPVVYAIPTQFPASLVVMLNPVTPVITPARAWFTGQSPQMIGPFWWLTGMTLILFVFGLFLYRLAMPHIVERMSA